MLACCVGVLPSATCDVGFAGNVTDDRWLAFHRKGQVAQKVNNQIFH